jgi:tetrahydromethanopterin S-methyltransferase subunit B
MSLVHAQSEAIQRALTPRLTARAGWNVYDNGPDHHPVTGRFRAWRHGVSIGHATLPGLLAMIDTKASERRQA